jgi:nucleoside-diphosphate-sugar epimerase
MINYIVSGSNGFVGQNLKKYILENLPNSNFLPISRSDLEGNNIMMDVQNACIVHLAGIAHDTSNTAKEDIYYRVNTQLTEKIFNSFLKSDAQVFIFLSSIKASADSAVGALKEDMQCNPQSVYGISKLMAEKYILSQKIPDSKRVYILRPCMIHGPGNKGNLNLLYKFASKGFPWFLGSFQNKRSFCSIENLCFVIKELAEQKEIESGIYNVADDEAISTNDIIRLIAKSQDKKARLWNVPQSLIKRVARIGDLFKLPLNTNRLQKLTEDFIVSNHKITNAIGKPLPLNAKNGLTKTIHSFK